MKRLDDARARGAFSVYVMLLRQSNQECYRGGYSFCKQFGGDQISARRQWTANGMYFTTMEAFLCVPLIAR